MDWPLISALLSATATLLTAIFTGLLVHVSRQQANILKEQKRLQEELAKAESWGMVFLEISPLSHQSPTFAHRPNPKKLYLVNLGKYACLVQSVKVFPSLDHQNEPALSMTTEGIIGQSIALTPGERKEFKEIHSDSQIIPSRSNWGAEIQDQKEVLCEIIYSTAARPDTQFRILFSIALEKDDRYGNLYIAKVSLKQGPDVVIG